MVVVVDLAGLVVLVGHPLEGLDLVLQSGRAVLPTADLTPSLVNTWLNGNEDE